MTHTRTILVADDNADNRSILEQFLQHLGFKVELCRDGMEALENLRRKKYDIIFTDVNMPVLTGIELLQALRQQDDQTPVVMITGYPSITLAVDSIKKGATDFLTKPFRLEHLEHIVMRIEKEEALKRENLQLAEEVRNKNKIERLNEELQKKIEEISLLYSISEMSQSVECTGELFDRIVSMASIITGGKEISILLKSRETGHLIPKRVSKESGKIAPIPMGQGVVGQAASEKRVIVVPPSTHRNSDIPHRTRGSFLSLPMVIKEELYGVLNISKPTRDQSFSDKEIQLLNEMISKCTLTLENHALCEGYDEHLMHTLGSLVMAAEAKDVYTRNHSQRVTDLSIMIARKMKRSPCEIKTLRLAGVLHDIGKIGIQETVLLKPGQLNPEEIETIRSHALIGERMVHPLLKLKEEQRIVRHHHEHYDGKGYPDGLTREEIPLLARILSLADAYDAMTSARPYRSARSHDFAVAEIRRCRKTQFDPKVADAFLSCSWESNPWQEKKQEPRFTA